MLRKKYTMMILILLLLLALSTLLMFQFLDGNYAVMGKKLSSWNNIYTIGVPRSWDECEPASSNGLVAAQTDDAEMFAMMSLDTYDYGPDVTLDSFVNGYMNTLGMHADAGSEAEMVTLEEHRIANRIDGYYYEFNAVSHGIPVHLFSYVTRVDEGFLTIDVAVNNSVSDEKRETAKSIINSLRINRENASQPEPVSVEEGADTAAEAAAEETASAEEEAEMEEDPVVTDSN